MKHNYLKHKFIINRSTITTRAQCATGLNLVGVLLRDMNLKISISQVVSELVLVTAMTTNRIELPGGLLLLDLLEMVPEQRLPKILTGSSLVGIGHDYELTKMK